MAVPTPVLTGSGSWGLLSALSALWAPPALDYTTVRLVIQLTRRWSLEGCNPSYRG